MWLKIIKKYIFLKNKFNLCITFFPKFWILEIYKFSKCLKAIEIGMCFSCSSIWYIIRIFSTSYAKVMAILLFFTNFCKLYQNSCLLIFLTTRLLIVTTSQRILFVEVFIIFFEFFENLKRRSRGWRFKFWKKLLVAYQGVTSGVPSWCATSIWNSCGVPS